MGAELSMGGSPAHANTGGESLPKSSITPPTEQLSSESGSQNADARSTPTLTVLSSAPTLPATGLHSDPVLEKYPFRAKVRHLPLEERKEKYEEEIRRLLGSPHSSHAARLNPEKIQEEKADIPPTKNAVVTWSEVQMTYDIGKGALSQRAFKRCNRSRPDPWRRYGALRKLHEIGGIGCTPPNQTGIRIHQKFYIIDPGSTPPPPPLHPPITSIDEYGTPDVLLNPKKRKNRDLHHEKAD